MPGGGSPQTVVTRFNLVTRTTRASGSLNQIARYQHPKDCPQSLLRALFLKKALL